MKKFLSVILILTLTLSMTACGGSTEKKADTLSLGETASTDIAEFTLENAEFAHYLSATINNTYLTPIEKTNTMYTAKTGKCYVSLTFTISNKDRGGSISFGESFAEWKPNMKVKYKKEKYEVFAFDLNNDNRKFNLSTSCEILKETGEIITANNGSGAMNELLVAGETVTFRTFGIIDVDPDSLKDGFELSLQVPNSDDKYETFTYSIPTKE